LFSGANSFCAFVGECPPGPYYEYKVESNIALLMIEWAIDQEIPLLAVHDSFAVRKQNEKATDQAKDAK
jgi:hypothetical protein